MPIVVEGTIAVDSRVSAFLKHFGNLLHFQRGNKGRANCVLDAMDRPKNLRQAIEVNHVTVFFAGMICGKAAMIWRMPVLRCDDEIEMRLQPIYDRHDLTSVV